MLFNSENFLFFFVLVFAIYWFVLKGIRSRNVFLILASYYFYACWDWRFLGLIVLSSLIDYCVGLQLGKTSSQRTRRIFLGLSLVCNLGILGIFKYYDFFAESFSVFMQQMFGLEAGYVTLNLVLPVGISFYTFQTLSYTIDVYKKEIQPTRNIVSFFAFVCFFPQLVAGPIERASSLLPQFERQRRFDYTQSVDGLRLILWGLFKKVVLADNCAPWVNEIFSNHASYSGSTLIVGVVLFAFQIYGDFSGYSDIALGTSRLLGIRLNRNFHCPYFSRNIAEFWKRWHISLSSWFRDYVYIPLGGGKCARYEKLRNVLIVFLVSGLWHGANWTFIMWGLVHAVLYLYFVYCGRGRFAGLEIASGRLFPSLREAISIAVTFCFVCIAWVFFRADSIGQAFSYLGGIPQGFFALPEIRPSYPFLAIAFVMFIEWFSRNERHGLDFNFVRYPRPLVWMFYLGLGYSVLFLSGPNQAFIYFQF